MSSNSNSATNNSGILATVGLNPVPSKGIYPTSSVLNDGKQRSIACYNAYNICFVPPYSQFSIANSTLNAKANTSLQNIPAENLINGTDFTNRIVMAPIQVTASSKNSTISLSFDYPEAEGTYTPFQSINLELSTDLPPAFTSLNFSAYLLDLPFYFPVIASDLTSVVDPVNIIESFGIYYSFYTVTCVVNEAGVKSCKFIQTSLQEIASIPSGTTSAIAVALVQASKLDAKDYSPNFFLFNPSVLNQSTIPETDFKTFTDQILSNFSPGLSSPLYKTNSQRILGILYFDQFSTTTKDPTNPQSLIPIINSQTINCVFGQIVLVAGSANIKTTAVCNPPVCSTK